MNFYNRKIIKYKDREKIICYDLPIICQGKNENAEHEHRRKYSELSDHEKELSDRRREQYYKHKICELIEISKLNDLNCMVTLTFADNISDTKEAYKCLALFFDRFKYYLKKQNMDELKYICCMEYQKRGAIHYHLICNCSYIPFTALSKLWGNGFVYIKKIKNDKAVAYALKYCVKNVMQSSNERRKTRYIRTSNNLIKPAVITEWTNDTIDDAIIDNLEDIICDGSYTIKNYAGNIINNARYIECRK